MSSISAKEAGRTGREAGVRELPLELTWAMASNWPVQADETPDSGLSRLVPVPAGRRLGDPVRLPSARPWDPSHARPRRCAARVGGSQIQARGRLQRHSWSGFGHALHSSSGPAPTLLPRPARRAWGHVAEQAPGVALALAPGHTGPVCGPLAGGRTCARGWTGRWPGIAPAALHTGSGSRRGRGDAPRQRRCLSETGWAGGGRGCDGDLGAVRMGWGSACQTHGGNPLKAQAYGRHAAPASLSRGALSLTPDRSRSDL